MQWWERIDRDDEREALRSLIPDGGCLVLEGDGLSGRPQAASLIEEALDEFGYRVVSARVRAGRPTSIRAVLIEAWKALVPPLAPNQVPPWLAHAGSLTTGFIASELKNLRTEEQVAVVLHDPDQLEPLTPFEVGALSDLASSNRWVVVVTSNQASASAWGALGAQDRRLVLRDFTYEDVYVRLHEASELAKRRPTELEEAAQSVVAAAAGTIRPGVAYTVLKAWSVSAN